MTFDMDEFIKYSETIPVREDVAYAIYRSLNSLEQTKKVIDRMITWNIDYNTAMFDLYGKTITENQIALFNVDLKMYKFKKSIWYTLFNLRSWITKIFKRKSRKEF